MDIDLHAAKRVAHYFTANVEKTDYVPLCDFRSPKEPVVYDTTAGSIALCGLLAIANEVGEYEKDIYRDAAIRILKALADRHGNFDNETDGIICYGSTAYHDVPTGRHVPIIYGDYFFIEGILQLMNKDHKIWGL